FCAACGARVAGALGPPGALSMAMPVMAPLAPAPMLLACRSCGRAMRPVPYFSRGVNVAKALALMVPFNVLGPLAFFFLRKDRLICAFCKDVMSGEVAVPLLGAFSS